MAEGAEAGEASSEDAGNGKGGTGFMAGTAETDGRSLEGAGNAEEQLSICRSSVGQGTDVDAAAAEADAVAPISLVRAALRASAASRRSWTNSFWDMVR